MPVIILRGKARQVWKAWDFIVLKLGRMSLGELVK